MSQALRPFSVLMVFLLLLGVSATELPSASAQSPSAPGESVSNLPSPGEPLTKSYPKLDSALAQIVIANKAQGITPALAEAHHMGLAVQQPDSVRVIIESAPGAVEQAKSAAESAGGVVEASYQDLVQARVPVSALDALSQAPSVSLVERPTQPVAETVTSEGVSLIGANNWQAAGYGGAGVKIAIVDLGFQGYQSLLVLTCINQRNEV